MAFSVLLGIVVGLLPEFLARSLGEAGDALVLALKTIGRSFVSLLSVTVPPLIFAAIVTSIGNLRQLNNAARPGGQTLLWFAITALISVTVAIALGLVLPSMHNSIIGTFPGKALSARGERQLAGLP